MSGFAVNLLSGIGERLETMGVGNWTAGALPAADDILISAIRLPQSPDRVVCLADYPVSATPGMTDTVIGIQARIRGTKDPRVVLDLADAVIDVLHGLRTVQLGTAPNQVKISQMYWQSGADLGPDAVGRYERTINFYVQVNRAGPNQGN